MKKPSLKALASSYAYIKFAGKGLDPAMIQLYKETSSIFAKDGIKYIMYNLRTIKL